jgi:hypothetical protein
MDRPLHGQSGDMGALYAAIATAQERLRPAIEDGQNPHFRSTYATLDSCWAAARAALAGSGVCVLQLPLTLPDGSWGIETRLGHSSGCELWRTWVLPASTGGRGNPLQSAGASLSLARRYALSAVLGITTGDDTDGEPPPSPAPSHNRRQAERRPEPARASQRPAEASRAKESGDAALRLWNAEPHPTWEEERKRFCGLIGELGLRYEQLKGWTVSLGRPKPSAMPSAQRAKLLEHLRGLDEEELEALRETGLEQAKRCAS